MKTLLTCCLGLFGAGVFAQQKPYTIQIDTINLHGFVYDNAGKPVKLMHIQSAQRETVHNYFKAGAYTDASGYFELKGAKFNDTLTIGPDIRYDIPPYYNKGSRFIAVYLPPAKMTDINSDKPFEIVQKRRSPRVVSSFNIQPFTDVGISQNVTEQAQYPGGTSALQDFIKQNLVYPEKAIKANAEGIVQVSFTVTAEGKVTDCKTLKGIGFDCDEELIHVLKKAAKWKPAVDSDRPVPVQQMITLMFRLSDN